MQQLRSPWARAFLVWTVVVLAVAALVAIDAVAGLLRAADDCWFGLSPCSPKDDPHLVQLQVAFFAIPAIWLAGVLIGVVAHAFARRR